MKLGLCAARAVGGCLIALVGCCMVVYIYAFATVGSAYLVGWDYWMLILRKMLLTPSVVVVIGGVLAFGVGAVTVALSIRMAFSVLVQRGVLVQGTEKDRKRGHH
jgi:hypothetical protein